jgi:RNA polymerase sigma factor (sigma-70 family)
MDLTTPDNELVITYAREASEPAFRALVDRHVNLVFSAAYRQVGDIGVAEEVTQNVFVALARKAPRLAGHETLAGWLHRTAILEAKAHIRAELRRRRREEAAATIASIQRDGATAADEVGSLLDEGLLNLRESDRSALILRYLEGRSLREVGVILGVEEDAARKRISRALDRLSEFFRCHGIAVPAKTGAALVTQAIHAAPAMPTGLAAAAAGAGISTGNAASGFQLFLMHMMTLTKPQIATVGLILATIPLGWQWHVLGEARQTNDTIAARLVEHQAELAEVEMFATQLRDSLMRAESDIFNATRRLDTLEVQRAALPIEPPGYEWDDALPVARVPKAVIRQMSMNAVANKRGDLTPQIRAALQLSDSESADVQSAVHRFLRNYHAAQASVVRRVEPDEQDQRFVGKPLEELRVFEIHGLQDTVSELRQEFFRDLATLLDPDRFELFKSSLSDWMALDDRSHGINTGMAIFDQDHQLAFHIYPSMPEGEPVVGWSFSAERSRMNATIRISDIPSFLRPHLQDWIDQIMAEAAVNLERTEAAAAQNP